MGIYMIYPQHMILYGTVPPVPEAAIVVVSIEHNRTRLIVKVRTRIKLSPLFHQPEKRTSVDHCGSYPPYPAMIW